MALFSFTFERVRIVPKFRKTRACCPSAGCASRVHPEGQPHQAGRAKWRRDKSKIQSYSSALQADGIIRVSLKYSFYVFSTDLLEKEFRR